MENREKQLLFVYLIFDLIIINACIIATATLEFEIKAWEFRNVSMYLLHGNLSWLITYFVFVKKKFHIKNNFLNRLLRISKRMVIFMVVGIVLGFLIMPRGFSRLFIIEYIILVNFSKVVFYFLLNRYSTFKRRRKLNVDSGLILNCVDTAQALKLIIEKHPLLGYIFHGFLCDEYRTKDWVIGGTDQLAHFIDTKNIQVVFAVISIYGSISKTKDYLQICNEKGVRLYLVPESQRWFANNVNMESVGGIMLINPQEIPLDDVGSRMQKRIFDIAFSTLVITLLFTWFLPLMALIIMFNSRGPIFFVQKRTGINNKSFKCIKFRSM
ncbi:MAG: sugar transferase, partial [Bacteroidales bacterium]|nr:sugar transferase [Bacteroidales bacterium]